MRQWWGYETQLFGNYSGLQIVKQTKLMLLPAVMKLSHDMFIGIEEVMNREKKNIRENE